MGSSIVAMISALLVSGACGSFGAEEAKDGSVADAPTSVDGGSSDGGNTISGRELYSGTLDVVAGTVNGAVAVDGLPNDPAIAFGHPVVTKDELTIYFSVAKLDEKKRVYVAARDAIGQPFGAPTLYGFIGETEQYPTWVSDDDCELWFIRDEKTLHRAVRQ